jgi:uncharacterized protein YbjT (DUF2867 family)
VIAASPSRVINTVTGEGLAEALAGTSVVVDVSNSPTLEPGPALEFFQASTGNLLAAESHAGVGHHVALSIVGVDRLPEGTYFHAKIIQEGLIRASPIPYTILRATQFFEFVMGIADDATDGNTVRIAPVLFQPMAADDVAVALARVAGSSPANSIVEVGGPEAFRFDELVRRALSAAGDPREVVTDPEARYYGGALSERTLVPDEGSMRGETRFEDWQRAAAAAVASR